MSEGNANVGDVLAREMARIQSFVGNRTAEAQQFATAQIEHALGEHAIKDIHDPKVIGEIIADPPRRVQYCSPVRVSHLRSTGAGWDRASHIANGTCTARSAQLFISAWHCAGLGLALSSSAFIGGSFVLTRIALQRASAKGNRAGAGGYGYFREPLWWFAMFTMLVGELANFSAYAYAPWDRWDPNSCTLAESV